jgi:cysteine desulfurase
MGASPDEAASAIRISLGWDSRDADIDHLVEAWGALYARAGRPVAASAA